MKTSLHHTFRQLADVLLPPQLPAQARRRQRSMMLWAGLLLVLCAALYGSGNRAYGLFDVDEAIFTQATMELREAAQTHGAGALVMPTYNAEPRYHKPPLFYWVQAATLEATGADFTKGGMGLLGARLPSILCAILAVGLLGFGVWHLTRNARWGLIAAAAFGLSLSFVVVGRAATADGLLNLTSVALMLWVLMLLFPPHPLPAEVSLPQRLRRTIRAQSLRRNGWIVTGGLGTLAFLAKGPIAWVPAGLVALALLTVRPDRALVWRLLAPFKVAILILVGLLPWALLLYQQHGWGFFYEFFVVHNLQRFGSDLGNSQSSFMGYYMLVLMLGFFPWVAFLPSALRAMFRRQTRPAILAALASPNPAVALPWLMLWVAVVYIGVFSFSGTKLVHYIIPAYPALAVVVGWWLTQPSIRPANALTSAFWLLWGVLLATIVLVVPLILEGVRGPTLQGFPALLQTAWGFEWPLRDAYAYALLQQPVPLGVGWWLVAAGVAGTSVCLIAVLSGKRRLLPLLVALWGGTLLGVVHGVVPTVWAYTQAPLARIADHLKQLPGEVSVAHLGLHKPSLLLLSGRPFAKLDNPVQVPPLLAGVPELWLVTEEPEIPGLLSEIRAKGGMLIDAKCTGGTCLLLLAPARVDQL